MIGRLYVSSSLNDIGSSYRTNGRANLLQWRDIYIQVQWYKRAACKCTTRKLIKHKSLEGVRKNVNIVNPT